MQLPSAAMAPAAAHWSTESRKEKRLTAPFTHFLVRARSGDALPPRLGVRPPNTGVGARLRGPSHCAERRALA